MRCLICNEPSELAWVFMGAPDGGLCDRCCARGVEALAAATPPPSDPRTMCPLPSPLGACALCDDMFGPMLVGAERHGAAAPVVCQGCLVFGHGMLSDRGVPFSDPWYEPLREASQGWIRLELAAADAPDEGSLRSWTEELARLASARAAQLFADYRAARGDESPTDDALLVLRRRAVAQVLVERAARDAQPLDWVHARALAEASLTRATPPAPSSS
ncbi:MAG: hypothetical protein R3F49_21185 [Planctomycetota bacterium]